MDEFTRGLAAGNLRSIGGLTNPNTAAPRLDPQLRRQGVRILPVVNGFVIMPQHQLLGDIHQQTHARVAKDMDEALTLAREVLEQPFRE